MSRRLYFYGALQVDAFYGGAERGECLAFITGKSGAELSHDEVERLYRAIGRFLDGDDKAEGDE